MEEWRAFVAKNKELGRITETDSPYAAPVFFIHKKDGSFRLVQDYHCYVLAQKTTCQSDFESDNNEGA